MRDNSEGMIELIDVLKINEGYFLIISVSKKSQRKLFRFAVTVIAYRVLRKILESRPLDNMPGLKYRYFWNGSMGKKTANEILLGIRCEVGEDGKVFHFEVPQSLAANLMWFNEIKTFDEAQHLSI
jgi:hypothetical protein